MKNKLIIHQIKKYTGSILLLIGLFSAFSLKAQDLDPAKVKELVASRHFVFKAQTMLPLGGPTKQLTTDYDMVVSGDSLVTYLPYVGRAYTPTLNGEGGVNFTATDFTYEAKEKKKGSWEIIMVPKGKDVRQLTLTISSNGTAYLQVISNSRQSISYNGYIIEKKK